MLVLTLVGLTSMIVSLGLHAGITYEVSRRRWPIGRALKTSYRLAFVLGLVGILGGLGFFLLTHHSIFGAIATSEPRAKGLCQKRLTKLAPATPC